MRAVDVAQPIFQAISVSGRLKDMKNWSANWLCRDDLTVEVIFFGEGNEMPPSTGDRITINEEATAKVADDIKPKL